MSSGLQHILLVDDDEDAVTSLARALSSTGEARTIHVATSAECALEIARKHKPPLVVSDLSIDDTRGPESGLDLLKQLLILDPTCRVIILTGHRGIEYGVQCLNSGASSFLEKPPNIPHLQALISDGLYQAELRRAYQALKRDSSPGLSAELVGSSGAIRRVAEAIMQAAQTNQSVLLTGETGTGKGLCAGLIHKLSARSLKNFVRYQPTFGTPDLIKSELFGHTKGAFTGAADNRRGLLADAHQGTLFLDEVDELPQDSQVSLLGVLQDKRFRPIGANREEISDFRLICASNRDLEKCVSDGKLRRDFYHRIAHCCIHLPPLRERLQDIPELCAFILGDLRQGEHVTVLDLEPSALAALSAYNWPGNIRELQAAIESAAYRAQFAGRSSINAQDLALRGETPLHNGSFIEQVEGFKLKLIEEALARNGGNQVRAAQDLKLDRSSMRRILARTR